MTKKHLIRCIECSELGLLSPVDQSPEYDNDQGEWSVTERDDKAAFLERHQGHRLEELQIIEDSAISHEDYGEPVGASYFEATNGQERFVVKRFRKSVSDPQGYELIPGKLHRTLVELHVDERAILKELEEAFSPRRLSLDKIRVYVKQLEETVSALDPGELEAVPFEGHNPSVRYFYLDEGVVDRVSERAFQHLCRADVKILDAFLRENLADDLFMAAGRIRFRVDSDGCDQPSKHRAF